MQQKTYLTILKTGIYLSLLSVFLVSDKLLFPYITTKQIYFNVLIEILAVFWFVFLIKYPEYRPKKSWISIGLISYFAAILVSCFFSVDFNLSFWGDIERMLGFFHIAHFLVLYFIVITVFRSWKDWRNLFIASVIAAALVCFYGLLKNIHYSTIGNTAYVSGYAIFNIFFALILMFRSRTEEGVKNINLIPVALYSFAIVVMFAIFRLTHTRGAYVGIGAGVLAVLFLLLILNKNKKVKIYSLSILAVFIVLVSLVFAYPQSAIVKNSSILRTITQISGQAVTFQTRLISWRGAIKDFPNHPIFGTGYGNFAITFDKYFDPSFYNYTTAETFFDRAHNNLIDIASTTGILGLLTYLSIFAAVGYYLINGFKKEKISLTEFVVLSGLIVAYFVQNLAVFDSLVTYIPLMFTLGFIYWLSERQEDEPLILEKDRPLIDREIFSFLIVGLLMFFVLFQYNIKPYNMLKGTILGQIAFAQGNIPLCVEIYKDALSHNTVLDRDSRDSVIRILANSGNLNNLLKEKDREILDWGIELAEKNLEYNPEDTLMNLQLSQILHTAAVASADNPALAADYDRRALEAVDRAIESSPGKVRIYFQKARIYFDQGLNDKGIETFEYAVSLNEDFNESVCQLAKVQIILEKEEGYENMDKCIDIGLPTRNLSANFIVKMAGHYQEKSDMKRLIKLYEALASIENTNAKVLANLASLYAKAREKEKAIEAAQKVIELDPDMKGEVDVFIRSLEE